MRSVRSIGALPPLDGEGGLSAAKVGWGARSVLEEWRERKTVVALKAFRPVTEPSPHPALRATLPIEGRES